ncbi:CLUMA_CG006617, isoform A [Clunio marinus]|uniref:CLUMA_CG006617, isoform A n=1 Tax=Clunio marinus TaxID=568069 RepID=A0A1J1HYF2_9DIPT|nr:CLUMA_CG006617, isoform A [Clunio marinus]
MEMENSDDRVYAAEKILKKRTRKRILETSESEEESSQVDITEREPPVKKEKLRIKEVPRKPETIKKPEIVKKDVISSPKIMITIPTTSLSSSNTPEKASPVSSAAGPIPKLMIPTEVEQVDDGVSSSSSDDQPIVSKDLIGAKRKAEVLSKESGKIGITIKKTTITNPLLSPKLKNEKKITAALPYTKEEEQDSSKSTIETISTVVPTIPAKKNSPPTKIYENKNTVKTEEPNTPEKLVSSSPENKNSSKENKFTNLMTNSNVKLLTSPKSAHPKLWLPKAQSTSNQIFITDVTVNLETVTIRECKTERGFFKSRQDMERNFTKAQ